MEKLDPKGHTCRNVQVFKPKGLESRSFFAFALACLFSALVAPLHYTDNNRGPRPNQTGYNDNPSHHCPGAYGRMPPDTCPEGGSAIPIATALIPTQLVSSIFHPRKLYRTQIYL
jgi:hypothetical protein